MIYFRRVSGSSMSPALSPGSVVVASSAARYKVADIVVARVGEREVIKRVVKIAGDHVWLAGDNASMSTDSRHYGPVDKRAILGVMKYTLPSSQPAPTLRSKNGATLGWVAAVVMIAFAVIHLFRIDTFVPELSRVLGNDRTLTLWVASAVVASEVFAVPFLLRMRLSVLAQYVSGALSVLVPLWWCSVAIWTYGSGLSTAQLGEFKALPSSFVLIAFNMLWVIFAYGTIWALGYDHHKGEKRSFVTKWLSRLSGTK
ncbi:MAG: S24/S26 family peptidase [Candidatus Saccharimonadales bacterium]